MSNIDNIRAFIASISENDLNNEELLEKSNKFFTENLSEVDAEFLNTLLSSKAAGLNVGTELMEEYAYKGSPTAQLAIGLLKLEGKGVEKNVPEAIFWFKRSYIGQNPNSGLTLFTVYANGIGVSQNIFKAREYLKRSAELGVPKAQYYFAGMLLEGEGGPVDEDLAIHYIFLAANNGYEDAISFIEDNDLIEV